MNNNDEKVSLLMNSRGIGMGDLMVLISVACAVLVFYIPEFIKPQADESLVVRAQTDLQILGEAVRRMEKHTGVLAGYPGPNSCVNDLEFENLEQCRLGLACTDGKYPLWNGPYLKDIPLDPWGRKYYLDNDYYARNGSVARVLGSKGPNGVQDYGDKSDDVIFVLCTEEPNKKGGGA